MDGGYGFLYPFRNKQYKKVFFVFAAISLRMRLLHTFSSGEDYVEKFVLGGMTALVLAACGGEGGSASSSAPAQSANASGSLIERINNKGTITVGTEGTYAPFTYHDKTAS